jgi:hypothetical protein
MKNIHKINQHTYITDDSEIKEGDWFTDDNNSLKRSYKLSHVQFANPKKIILTTDQDLIKDGVQIVKGVGIESFNNGYKIIIPKEEQDKKLYSEEEVLEILFELSCNSDTDKEEVEEWFEQFKKK